MILNAREVKTSGMVLLDVNISRSKSFGLYIRLLAGDT
jgi:hypothetical protein